MRDTRTTRLIASLIIVGAWVWLLWFFLPFPPPPHRLLHEGLGQALAEEALRVQGEGGRLVVIRRETSEFRSPATDLQVRGFQQMLQEARQTITQTKLIKIDPLRVVAAPPGDFFELIRKSTEADVIVSFMGPPALNDTQISVLPAKHARIIALCAGSIPAQVDLKRLFTHNLLQAAILSRPEIAAGTKPATPRAWFDLYYQVITPANLAELPEPRRARPQPNTSHGNSP